MLEIVVGLTALYGAVYYSTYHMIKTGTEMKHRFEIEKIDATQRLLQDPAYQSYLQSRRELTENLTNAGIIDVNDIALVVNNALGELALPCYALQIEEEQDSS